MKRGRLWLWSLLSLLLLSGIAVWRLFPHNPRLLERSTRIADTSAWYQGKRFNPGIDVHWLSDHDLLYSKFEGPQNEQRVIYRCNLLTGQETLLPGLTDSRDNLPAEVVDDQKVSPDGKWYLCSARWDDCLLAEVNGAQHFIYPSQDSADYRHFYWSADSRYWLEAYVNGREAHCLQLHDTRNPKSSVSLSLKGREALIGNLEAVITPDKAISIQDLGPERESMLPPEIATFKVTLFSLTDSRSPATEYLISLRGAAYYHDIKVSPQGGRLVWRRTRIINTIPDWLRRLPVKFHNETYAREELWVSHIDGSGMHLIGSLPDQAFPQSIDDNIDGIRDLKWLPGGHRLSFERDNILYTVPAD